MLTVPLRLGTSLDCEVQEVVIDKINRIHPNSGNKDVLAQVENVFVFLVWMVFEIIDLVPSEKNWGIRSG
jgi:hypothetical protein